jgi:transcriptional regulator with XRE-family HTH domain
MIVIGMWTGQEAGALRHALRMTIREFAEHLGVAVRTVAKWEAHGSAIAPMPVMQAALDTALARAPDEVKSRFSMLLAARRDSASVSHSVAHGAEEDETQRRIAMKAIAAGFAAATLPTFDGLKRLAGQPKRANRIDSKLVTSHEELAGMLAGLYRSADPRAVLPMAIAYADDVLGLLDRPMHDRDRARLNVVVVGVYAQTGLWACHAGDWAGAYRHLATACDVAAAADQPSLHAEALGAFSYLFSSAPRGGQGGDPPRALALLDQALDQAAGADGFTRGWLATWRADQRATLGEVKAALVDVDAADRGLAATDDRTKGFFSRATYGYGMDGHLNSARAVALALAGHTAESDQAFSEVLSSAKNLRRRVCTFGHLAMVRAAAGEPEGACEALTNSIELARPVGYAMGLERAAGVRARFDPRWSSLPCVRELDEQLQLTA